MEDRSSPSKRPYVAFAVTAVFYVCAVLLLVGWLYALHRAELFEQTAQGLQHAVLAAREFAGNEGTRTHISNGLTNAPAYAQHQERFNRYAKACNLTLLAMARQEADTTFLLMASDQSVYPNGSPVGHLGEPLPDELISWARELSDSQHSGSRLLTTQMDGRDPYPMQLALLYVPEDQTKGFLYFVGKNGNEMHATLRALLIRKLLIAFFMLVMMIPLLILFNRVQRRNSEKLGMLNSRLRQDMEKQQEREAEFKEAIRDLERFNQVAAGREMRIIELKSEVNELLLQLDREARYHIGRID